MMGHKSQLAHPVRVNTWLRMLRANCIPNINPINTKTRLVHCYHAQPRSFPPKKSESPNRVNISLRKDRSTISIPVPIFQINEFPLRNLGFRKPRINSTVDLGSAFPRARFPTAKTRDFPIRVVAFAEQSDVSATELVSSMAGRRRKVLPVVKDPDPLHASTENRARV